MYDTVNVKHVHNMRSAVAGTVALSESAANSDVLFIVYATCDHKYYRSGE